MARYDRQNNELMAEFGLKGTLPWGEIKSIRVWGDVSVVSWDNEGETVYSPYVNGRETGMGADSWDEALLIGLAFVYGENGDAGMYAARVLNMKQEKV